jgi:hypothetical protein
MATAIYILQLEHDCWYVGRSTGDIQDSIEAHMKGRGCTWTKLHRPIQVHEIFHDMNPFDEDKCTKQYMALYGMDKVRGGTYSLPVLSQQQKTMIQKELWNAQDRCIDCGGDHHVYRCPLPLPPLPPKPVIPGESTSIWTKASSYVKTLINVPPSQQDVEDAQIPKYTI